MSSNRDRVNAQGKRKQYSAPALEKGLDILELLAGEPEGLTISQIADSLVRSVGEIFRMVVVLDQRGYIHASGGSDLYAVTLKIFEIAHKIPAIARLESAAALELRGLSHEIGQSCHVVIYYDGRGHVVVQQDAPSERVMTVRLGAEAPLVNTCSGHVLLAFASPQQRAMMIGEIPRGQRKPTKKELVEPCRAHKGPAVRSDEKCPCTGSTGYWFPDLRPHRRDRGIACGSLSGIPR